MKTKLLTMGIYRTGAASSAAPTPASSWATMSRPAPRLLPEKCGEAAPDDLSTHLIIQPSLVE